MTSINVRTYVRHVPNNVIGGSHRPISYVNTTNVKATLKRGSSVARTRSITTSSGEIHMRMYVRIYLHKTIRLKKKLIKSQKKLKLLYGPQEATRSVDAERAADRACSDGCWPWTSLRPIRAVASECHRRVPPSGDASVCWHSEASDGDPARSRNQESDRSRGRGGRQTRLRSVIHD